MIKPVLVMANTSYDPSVIEQKLRELDEEYNKALHAGEKFSVLKEIRDKINHLLQQMPLDGANGELKPES
jgi:hypothetical protein